ncbi:MAG: PEGA domain-containing protein [Polyangiaceae bacterium]|nr:PEGA domain-containing protein [Polyangiaceae bacterium]
MSTTATSSSVLEAFRRRFFRQTVVATACVCLVATACEPTRPATVSLRVAGNVPDAHVTVDDQYLGALAYVAKRGVALPPGQHRITVEKTGFFAWDRVVVAREGDPPIKLDVVLVEIPD